MTLCKVRYCLGTAVLLVGVSSCVARGDWTAADSQAVRHVIELAEGQQTLTLDLSDSETAHFLRRHHEAAGLTLDRYPGLHGLIDAHAEIHATEGVSYPNETQVSEDLTYSDLATIMLALYPTAATTATATTSYAGSAAASMEAVSDDPARHLQIAYTGLCFYDQQGNQVGTCATSNSFGAGQYFPVSHTVATSNEELQGVFTATYHDTTSKRFISQLSTLSVDALDYPLSQTIANPVILHAANNALKTALVCTSRTVNSNVNPGICDYGLYANTNVLVTMEGSVTYKPTQTPKTDASGHLVGTGSVSLINTKQGGGCRLSPSISGTNFFSQPQVTYNTTSKTLAWNFSNLDFGSATKLICGGDGTSIQFSFISQVQDSANNDDRIVASQQSQAGVITPHFAGPNAGAYLTPMLRLVAGCLHPETQITLAGRGGARPISEFTGEGELVRSMGGAETHVVGTVDGEEESLYVIRAGNREVKATAQHPFVAADGNWRSADELQAGDQVLTASGPVTIESVDQVRYGGPVVNLMLAHIADALHPETGTFYANGFLVGGHDAQQKLAAAKLASPKRVEGLLPAEFKVDYASHLEDQQSH